MKITKTETEYNMKSIRFLSMTINTMFLVIGCLMIILGLSVYGHYHNFSMFYESVKSGRLFTPSILTVILGFAMMIVTSFGFFGSIKKSTCMVNTYGFILTLMLIVKLVIVILLFSMDSDTIMRYIYLPIHEYDKDQEIRDEIDEMQILLNCCGSDSYLDYSGMEFSNHSVVIEDAQIGGEDAQMYMVPESCCSSINNGVCSTLRTTGCKSALVNLVVQNSSILGVLGVSVMFIQALGVIFALLLARSIRKLKSERGLLSWKIREKMIMARNEEIVKKMEKEQQNRVVINYIGSSHV